MSRLCIATRGIGSWRERLASPDTQWRRRCYLGLWRQPCPGNTPPRVQTKRCHNQSCRNCFETPSTLKNPYLLLRWRLPSIKWAAAPGGRADFSVRRLGNSSIRKSGGISLSLEAMANEAFGQGHQSLAKWLVAGDTEQSRQNRIMRWDAIKEHLPGSGIIEYSEIAYQLLTLLAQPLSWRPSGCGSCKRRFHRSGFSVAHRKAL